MFKHALIIVVCSIAAILFQSQLSHVVHWLLNMHDQLAVGLGNIFTSGPTGAMIQKILALIIIPVVGGGVAALVFFLIKKGEMPHILITVWIVWTVLLVTMVAQTPLAGG